MYKVEIIKKKHFGVVLHKVLYETRSPPTEGLLFLWIKSKLWPLLVRYTMTRMSKKGKRRALSPRKHKYKLANVKSGSKKDFLNLGYKPHDNALEGSQVIFIAKVK